MALAFQKDVSIRTTNVARTPPTTWFLPVAISGSWTILIWLSERLVCAQGHGRFSPHAHACMYVSVHAHTFSFSVIGKHEGFRAQGESQGQRANRLPVRLISFLNWNFNEFTKDELTKKIFFSRNHSLKNLFRVVSTIKKNRFVWCAFSASVVIGVILGFSWSYFKFFRCRRSDVRECCGIVWVGPGALRAIRTTDSI